MQQVNWNLQRAGRAWESEAMSRWELTPEKIEMINGKLFHDDDQRLLMLGLLLENLGVDAAVRLGGAAVWREAIAALEGRGA